MFYLDQIMNNGTSGIIKIDCPIVNRGRVMIEGFCTDDITVSLGNEWGSILPGLETITALSQFLNTENIIAWLAGTQACWKGSNPLTIPITFYVFSYSKEKSALRLIEPLIELAGVSEGNGKSSVLTDFAKKITPEDWHTTIDRIADDITVSVHAGYKVNVFQGNDNYIQTYLDRADADYTVKIHLGTQITIDSLLLSKIQVTHSNIQVANGKPLYVKVQADFRTVGVPTVKDIQRWYGR